jgi:hypothetical protein
MPESGRVVLADGRGGWHVKLIEKRPFIKTPDTFCCAFCGSAWPVSELAGWSGPRRFCESCVALWVELTLPRAA